jgi:hypothetical protein
VNRLGLVLAAGLLAGGVFLSAQSPAVPAPRRGSGDSITAAYEGWYYNPDGSRAFLIGYYNRNSQQELDVPIGPNNRIEPGGPDMSQPTHFLPGRQWGMFTIQAPKEFKPTDEYRWTITANGQTTTVPFRLRPDYVMSPFSEISVGNTPPVIRFEQGGRAYQGPLAMMSTAAARNATVGTPTPLSVWLADDMKYTSGTSAPVAATRQPLTMRWSMYRGPAKVTFDKARPDVEKVATGEGTFNGKTSTTAKFTAPGDYVLHVTANDYSGDGGGGFGCCWSTALVKVAVK